MSDVVVTCPASRWADWLAEGDLPGDPPSGDEYVFSVGRSRPDVKPGDRVYVVALGKLRGYAPLLCLSWSDEIQSYGLFRGGGAVAVTIRDHFNPRQPATIKGFRGFRYRWWERSAEVPFPGWRAS